MTEPVAYWHIPQIENEEIFVDFKPSENSNFEDIPLYTAEDLQPRVKMTQAEFDEFNKLLLSSAVTIYEVIDTIYKYNGKMNNFSHLYQRLFNGNDKLELENQLEFSKLWANFNIENPEETIEIVPDMKWFVISKKRDDEGDFEFISGIETPDAWGYSKNHNGVNDPRACAYAFDTKEEAELWLNPLTEAVQLPVEGE